MHISGCTVGWHFRVRALLVRDLQALSLAVAKSTTSLPSPVKEKSAQFCKIIHSCRHLCMRRRGSGQCGDARVRAVHKRRSIPHAKHGFFDVHHLHIGRRCLVVYTIYYGIYHGIYHMVYTMVYHDIYHVIYDGIDLIVWQMNETSHNVVYTKVYVYIYIITHTFCIHDIYHGIYLMIYTMVYIQLYMVYI